MVIEAPSLRFTTEFDGPDTSAPVPVTVGSGQHEALRVVDNVQRRIARLGRCEGSPALVGLKIAPDPRPLRVTVEVFADRATASMWTKFGPSGGTRCHLGPRLLIVRSQGATRAAVMLARSAGQFEFDAHTTVTFDLPANGVDAGGLLVVELAEAAVPDWAYGRLAPMPAIGIGIDKIAVRPVSGDPAPATVAMPPRHIAALGGGFIPIGPGTLAGDRTSWRLRAGVLGAVGTDPPPLDRSGPFPVRIPGKPDLTNRDKMWQLARRKLKNVRRDAWLTVLHTVVRAGRVVAYPLAGVAQGGFVTREMRSGRLAPSLIPLGTAPLPDVTVARKGYRTIQVSVPHPLTEPALFSLRTGNNEAGRIAWQLVRERGTGRRGADRGRTDRHGFGRRRANRRAIDPMNGPAR
jgi:hypothetical protein